MGLTLELPPSLEAELTREASREGISPAEQATLLLCIATALLNDDPAATDPFRRAVRLAAAVHDAGKFSAEFQSVVTHCVPPLKDLIQAAGRGHRRVSALGKYAHLGISSEDYAREKREEIEREDRRFSR